MPGVTLGSATVVPSVFAHIFCLKMIYHAWLHRVMVGTLAFKWIIFTVIFSTRKRSLRRLCFYTCLSVHKGEGTWVGPPQVQPLSRYTPWAGTPPPRQEQPPDRYTPPGRYTPQPGTPPTTEYAGIRSTSRRYAPHSNAFLFVIKFNDYIDNFLWKNSIVCKLHLEPRETMLCNKKDEKEVSLELKIILKD